MTRLRASAPSEACQISCHTRNKGQAHSSPSPGRQTAIRADLFPAALALWNWRGRRKDRRPGDSGRPIEISKPRLKRGGEDCDAGSEHSAKSRKYGDFSRIVDPLAAGDGRTLRARNGARHGSSQRIMVYWSLARAGPGREPGTADFCPAFLGLRGGEHTTWQAKC